MPPSRVQLAVGGMWISVYGLAELRAGSVTPKRETAVLFFLHGRFGSAERIEHIVHKTYEDAIASLPGADGANGTHEHANRADGVDGHAQNQSQIQRGLLIVTLDHRNHGTRMATKTGQQSWAEGNLKHAQDMLAMQTGTAQDVSFLADFLPSFLFPDDEIQITKWAITGISLGGHSVWIVLKNDARFKIGVPMLGCPSYRGLMRHRAAANNLPYAPPYMPGSLIKLLSRSDPDSVPYTSTDASLNPYIGKNILILHGEKDDLVPWDSSRQFAEALEVGPHGHKSIVIEPDRGHETSALMIAELVKWIVRHGMLARLDPASSAGYAVDR